MLKKKYLTVAILASVASMSFYAQSGTHSFDARSTGMGGIGVSSADYLTAAFHNPALVAKFNEDDDVGLLLPYIGAQAQDPEELVDQLDDFSDLYDDFGNVNTLSEAENIVKSLKEMQGDTAYIQAGVGGSIAIPNTVLSVSVYTKAYADGFIVADIHDADLDPYSYIDPNYELKSQSVALGVSIVEVGVAMAKSFKLDADTIYVGFTPKYQNVTTINYAVSIDNYDFDDVDDDRYQSDESNVNVDVGVAYTMGENFVFGFVGKNLIEQSYDTVSNANIQATYVVNPVYTVSASYNHSLFTIGLDIDLNESERYEDFTGLSSGDVKSSDDNIQMAGIGAEFNAWDWAQIRVGYQSDLADTLDDQVTAGIGFSPFGVLHLDLAAMYSGDEQFGASLQAALTF